MKIVFDLEADNLLYDATEIHCGTTLEVDSGNLVHYDTSQVSSLIDVLHQADLIIGHNVSGYDIPLLEKLCTGPHSLMNLIDKCRDTYVMSKLFYPNRQEHSLESWGKKVGISKPQHEDWSVYSEEMKHRNIEDTKINAKVYEYMVEHECKGWPQWVMAIKLEGHMHYWQAYQEQYGVGFDKEGAEALVVHLDKKIAEIEEELDPILPMHCKQVGVSISKPFKKDGDYAKRVIDWFEQTEQA